MPQQPTNEVSDFETLFKAFLVLVAIFGFGAAVIYKPSGGSSSYVEMRAEREQESMEAARNQFWTDMQVRERTQELDKQKNPGWYP